MKELKTISPAGLGRRLRGAGVNLLVRDVARTAAFLREVLGFAVHQQSADYALLSAPCAVQAAEAPPAADAPPATQPPVLLQLHADHTYHAHPLPRIVHPSAARGAGVELRLFECDPDDAEARATDRGYVVLQSATDKPHGLRECVLLDPDGYCWVPSRPLPPPPAATATAA